MRGVFETPEEIAGSRWDGHSKDNLDLTELRRIAESVRADWHASRISLLADGTIALLDRIEQAEALASRLSKKRDDRYELAAEKKIALTRLARVKALHTAVVVYEIDPVNGTWVYEGDERKVIGHLCQECTDDDTLADLEDEGWQDDGRSVWHPCATIRAVAADEQEREKCLHCRRPMDSEDGRYWIHAEGVYRGKARCDPDDSGLPYGYNAHPDVATGEQVGCLCRGVAEDEQEAGA